MASPLAGPRSMHRSGLESKRAPKSRRQMPPSISQTLRRVGDGRFKETPAHVKKRMEVVMSKLAVPSQN